MFALKQRAAADGVEHHSGLEVRVYEGDWAQGPRIQKARAMVKRAIAEFGALPEPSQPNGWRTSGVKVVELGCGTADISGPMAETCRVFGVDCNSSAIAVAQERFPSRTASFIPMRLDGLRPCRAGVLILCETLEHLEDPRGLVAAWLPKAKHCIISHPLDEPMGSGLSNGDHQWSFTLDDFKGWFAIGGHELVEHELFEMGAYKAVIGRGRRLAAD